MPPSISIDDLIARILNVGKIPSNFENIVDYLAKHAYSIEEKLENANDIVFDQNSFINKDGNIELNSDSYRQSTTHEIEMLNNQLYLANYRHKCAYRLQEDILWEIENLENTILKVVHKDSGALHLDLRSAAKWAEKNHAIARFSFEELAFDSNSINEYTPAENEAIIIEKNGLTKLQAKRYLITFALAIEELVASKKDPKKYGSPDDINLSAVADDLCTRFITDFGDDSKSYEDRTVRNRIKNALAMKKVFGPINP